MKGNAPIVLVILLKWSALSYNRIKGTVEIWCRDTGGNLISTTMVIIYSSPRRGYRPEGDIN